MFEFISSLLFLFMATESEAAVNRLCEKARLASLTFSLPQRMDLKSDICKMSEEVIPPIARTLLEQITNMHQAAGNIMELPVEKLIVTPIYLRIEGSQSGPIVSAATIDDKRASISVGVFPNWSGEDLNEAVYLHELGHVIGSVPNQNLPTSYVYLSKSFLMSETLADMIAVQATGTTFSPSVDLPGCLSELRPTHDSISFSDPIGNFSVDFTWNRFYHCCQDLSKTQKLSENAKSFCDRQLLPNPLDLRPMTFELYQESRFSTIDQHLLGGPIISFFVDFQNGTGLNWGKMILKALRAADSSQGEIRFCSVASAAIPPQKVEAYTIRNVFSVITKSLNDKNLKIFNELWEKHGMQTAVDIGLSELNETLPLIMIDKKPFSDLACAPYSCEITCVTKD
ncbi:MAG: hypothetical protein AB7O96_05650 [Pseudobdellovibrionaceae bacterium]